MLAREVATKSHTRAAHLPHLERVVFAVGVASTHVSLLRRRQLPELALGICRGVTIVKIVVAQLNSKEVEIERPNQSRQPMPWDEEVDEVEDFDEDRLEQRGLEVW